MGDYYQEVDARNALMRGEAGQPPPEPIPTFTMPDPILLDLSGTSQCQPLCDPAQEFVAWILDTFPDIQTSTSCKRAFEIDKAVLQEWLIRTADYLPTLTGDSHMSSEAYKHKECIYEIQNKFQEALIQKERRIADYFGLPNTADIVIIHGHPLSYMMTGDTDPRDVQEYFRLNRESREDSSFTGTSSHASATGQKPQPSSPVSDFLADIDNEE